MSEKRKYVKRYTKLDRLIFQYVCDQLTNEQMGMKLNMKKRQVEKKRMALNKKIGVKNTAGLVMYAIVNRLVKQDKSLKT
ncbi:MAG: hypothetical protein JKX73_06110 [Flavobacteriales bacterium]|nr:hypothetical protein [Flavobacteriales bacterium]